MDPIFSLTAYEYRQAHLAFRRGLIKKSLSILEGHLLTGGYCKVNDLRFWLLSIRCHLALGNFSRALFQAQQTVTQFPHEPMPLFLLAKAMEKQGRKFQAEAQACYRKVLVSRPHHRASLNAIVRLLCREQKFDEARTFQRSLVQIQPKNPIHLARLARMAHTLGDHAETDNLIRQGRFLFPRTEWFARQYRNLGQSVPRIHRKGKVLATKRNARVLKFLSLRIDRPESHTNAGEPAVLRLQDSPRFTWTRQNFLRDRRTPG